MASSDPWKPQDCKKELHNLPDPWSVTVGIVIWLAVGILSASASTFMFVTVSRLPERLRCKLMARQMWHLALADMCSSSLGLLMPTLMAVDVATSGKIFHDPHSWDGFADSLCSFVCVASIFEFAASLIDIHIALTAAAKLFHWSTTLTELSSGLWAVWPSGVVLGAVFIVFTAESNRPYYAKGCHICRYTVIENNVLSDVNQEFKNSILFMSVVVSAVVYTVTVTLMPSSTEAHRSHITSRTLLFILGNLACVGPFSLWSFIENNLTGNGLGHVGDKLFFLVICPLYGLSGFLHACVYLLLCKRAKHMVQRAVVIRDVAPEDVFEPIGDLSPGRFERQKPLALSFCVSFQEPEVVGIPADGADARTQAEMDLSDIERERLFQKAQDMKQQELVFACFDDDDVNHRVSEQSLQEQGRDTLVLDGENATAVPHQDEGCADGVSVVQTPQPEDPWGQEVVEVIRR